MTTISTQFPMQTSPVTHVRAGPLRVNISDPFIIATRETDPSGGTLVYPRLWSADGLQHVDWHFDRDMLDARPPEFGKPHGRTSSDGGRTWTLPPAWSPKVHPLGCKASTAPGKAAAFGHSFAIDGQPGVYRMATWRSQDSGRTWGPMTWTTIHFPGTRAMDWYDPPEQFRHHSSNYKGDSLRREVPPWMLPLFEQAGTRLRGPTFHSIVSDHAGVLHALSVARHLPGGDAITNDDEFFNRLDWTRNAILEHVSTDGGFTWNYRGIVAFDQQHRIHDFDEENCFSEPAMVLYPDGWGICLLRIGSFRPLHVVYTHDHGATWSEPEPTDLLSVDPHLVAMPNDVLVLATGRPDCTLHVSLDRGRTWSLSETLYVCTRGHVETPGVYNNSTSNTGLTAVNDRTLLYVHDASRVDLDQTEPWLRRAGFTRVVGRLIEIERDTRGTATSVSDCLCSLKPHRPSGPPGSQRTIEAAWRDGAIDVAKALTSDALWHDLPKHELVNVETGRPVQLAASVRAAWADGALWLHVDCPDPDVRTLRAMVAQAHDEHAFWCSDLVELIIRTPLHSYYQIDIGPSGRHVDLDRAQGIEMRWKSQATIVTHISDAGWSVRARLPVVDAQAATRDPFTGIAGSRPTSDHPWLINVCRQRVRPARHDLSSLVPTGAFGFHLPVTFATLKISGRVTR